MSSDLLILRDHSTGAVMVLNPADFTSEQTLMTLKEWFEDAPEQVEHAIEQLADGIHTGAIKGVEFASSDIEALLNITVEYA